MGTPLELVSYDSKTGKFSVGKQATDALRSCRGPVGVVAVCGRARQGKSFILNQLLQQTSGGFQVGPTHRPCTKGLWMWSTPQPRSAVDGSTYHLVLLDTEGIDAYDQTAQYSTQIFSLAVLLSSLFVYNQMGGIDEAALDRLSLVTEMTKRIRLRANTTDSDVEELTGFTPAFLWLLRDFYLTLEEDGRQITPQDYLETALMAVGGSGPSVESKNKVREAIKSLFPDRMCFTLVRPMHNEGQLASMDRTPRSQMRPEFQQGMEDLTRLIFTKALPKRVGTQVVTGPVLAGLLHAYVDAINGGAVPTIATAWQGVAEAECRRALDLAEHEYTSTFNTEVPPEDMDMEREHQRALAAARAVFEEVSVGEGPVKAAHLKRLHEAIGNRHSNFKAMRMAEAAAAVNDMLMKGHMQLSKALASEDVEISAVLENLRQWVLEYQAAAAGPTKWQRLSEFLVDAVPSVLQQVVRQVQERGRREVEKMAEALAQAQQRAAQAEAAARQASEQQVRGGKESAALKAALEDRRSQLKALEGQMREMCVVNESKLRSAEKAVEARLTASELDFDAAVKQLQSQLAAKNMDCDKLQGQVDTLESQCHSLRSTLEMRERETREMHSRCSSTGSDRAAAVARVQQLETELQAEGALRQAAEHQREAAMARVQQLMEQVQQLQQQQDLQDNRAEELLREAKAARRGGAARSMSGNDCVNENDSRAANTTATNVGSTVPLEKMTVGDIKQLLVQRNHTDAVWKLNGRQPGPKKSDWVDLARSLLG